MTGFRAYVADYRCEQCEDRIEVSWVQTKTIRTVVVCGECKGRAHLLSVVVSSANNLKELSGQPA